MIFKFEHFEADESEFRFKSNGQLIELEPKAFRVLLVLLENPNRLVRKQELLDAVWKDSFVTESTLTRTISLLRKVLGDGHIETVPTLGYRFKGEVEVVPDPARSIPAAALEKSFVAAEAPRFRNVRDLRWLVALSGVFALVVAIAVSLHLSGLDLRLRNFVPESKIQSVAVLPLDNLSGEANQEYFAEGMTDELITMLAKNSTLRVTSRTSIMQYKGGHRALPQIARELGVDAILEGTIERTGDHVHMNVQLIRASSDAHIWAESYDGAAKDVASLPREAAQAIARKLDHVTPQTTVARYINPEAHDAYLHGRYLWFAQNASEESGTIQAAGKYFRKAIELQPDYADAWSGLSDYYGGAAVGGTADPRQVLGEELAAARKAVELDDSNADAHLSLAAAYFFHDWNWALTEQEINRALELNPRLAQAYSLRSMLLATLNRHAEAIEAAKKNAEIGPFEEPSGLAWAYVNARQFDRALKANLDRLEADPRDPDLHFALSWIYLHYGKLKEGSEEKIKAYALAGENDSAEGLRKAYLQGGYQATLVWLFNQNKKDALTGYVPPGDQAVITARLGRGDEAIAYLEQAYQQHSPVLLNIQNMEPFDFLHGDPRYRSLIKRIGLPPAY
jgi:TolB-like protein/DNA-binding winged helix-turn-helix (wHTH) protein/Tfp pilus assembly protein PilF